VKAVWPFKSKTFLGSDDETWLIETWRSFLQNFGGVEDLSRSPLVTPSRTFFPPTDATGHARAEYIFDLVKTHARMADWPCKLIAQPPRPETRINDVVFLQPVGKGMPLGTFSSAGNEIIVSYDPGSVDDPWTLVATLAHELAHYILMAIRDRLPGGDDMHEYATDLLTVYMGFGLFGANCAFNFSRNNWEWKWSRKGYLPERAWAFALALFFQLREQSVDEAERFLKASLVTDLDHATRYLKKRPELLATLA